MVDKAMRIFEKSIVIHRKTWCFSVVFLWTVMLLGQTTPSGKVWYGVKYLGMAVDTAKVTNDFTRRSFVKNDNEAERFLKPERALYRLEFQGDDSWFKPIRSMALGSGKSNYLIYTFIGETLKKGNELYVSAQLQHQLYYRRINDFDRAALNGTYDWHIKEVFKTILGYRCQKAVALVTGNGNDQKITAWFTKEIPVSAGPGRIVGLPGLILAVNKYGSRYYYARKMKLNDKVKLHFPPDKIFISSKEFFTKLRALRVERN